MIYLTWIIAAVTLFILYRFFPRKKFFVYFCILLLIVFGVSAFISTRQAEQEKISREQIEAIRHEQQIFIDWYAAYQKNIEQLDRNWQLYYDIVETLRTAEIYEQVTDEQISELLSDAIGEQIKIHNLAAPEELSEVNRILLSEVIHKTQIYSDAQVKTISALRTIVNPDSIKNLPELNKQIKDITIREVPAGLFTAKEISTLRENLIVPEEGVAP